MLSTVSQRTRDRIAALTRETSLAGVAVIFCPCRVLPETVLNLKALMVETQQMWRETLGVEAFDGLMRSAEGSAFFAGEVRLVRVQEGRPEMVGVWLPVPPDYPERLKVQLVDAVEPFEFPQPISGTGLPEPVE